MSRVTGIRSGASIGAAKAAPAPKGGFSVAADSQPTTGLAPARAAQPAGLLGMLALQEAETQTSANKNGRRQGFAVLDALQELQHGLLTAGNEGEELAKLKNLARNPAAVTDPGLADILSAIRLRAKIELLRRGVEPG